MTTDPGCLPAPCSGCGTTMSRQAINDEFVWRDSDGRVAIHGFGLPDGYATVYELLDHLAQHDILAYSALAPKVTSGMDPYTHYHDRTCPCPPGTHPVPPDHCGWPAMLTPDGWVCRQCGTTFDG